MYELANESPEYRKLRQELLEAELALKDQRERIAELRRQLPADTLVEDYALRGIDLASPAPAARSCALSELFEAPKSRWY